MDANRYDRGITVRKSLGLPGQFGHIVDPEPLYVTWFFERSKYCPMSTVTVG
jgi:hypothetical protein